MVKHPPLDPLPLREGRMATAGFTLLELLISLTLLAVMAGILTGGFHLSIRAWEAGEKRLEGRHDVAESVNLIKRQLKMARNVTYRLVDGDNRPRLAFIGKRDSVTFVTAVPRFRTRDSAAGLFIQKIEFDPETGAIFFMEAEFEPSRDINDYDWTKMPMAAQLVESIRFEYFIKGEKENAEGGGEDIFIWTDRVNVEDETKQEAVEEFPRAVRFYIAVPDEPDRFVWPVQTVPVYRNMAVEFHEK